MSIETKRIDNHIRSLLNRLLQLQNSDGSFTTNYLQPEYQPKNGWMEYPDNSPFCTASVLIPLLKLETSTSEKLLNKGVSYLRTRSSLEKLWWFGDFAENYVVPFDTDTTSLVSFVLQSQGQDVNNKQLLLDQKNKAGHVELWFMPKRLSRNYFYVWYRNRAASRCVPIQTDLIRYGDYEFAVTCNNLLYLGADMATEECWSQVHSEFNTDTFQCMYYPSRLNAVYTYARACYYNQKSVNTQSVGARNYLQMALQVANTENLDGVLLATSMLYFNQTSTECQKLFQACLDNINSGHAQKIFGFYSSNLNTDVQSDGCTPNTYFGSEAITVALYLEFLNLYRFRMYGAFFS